MSRFLILRWLEDLGHIPGETCCYQLQEGSLEAACRLLQQEHRGDEDNRTWVHPKACDARILVDSIFEGVQMLVNAHCPELLPVVRKTIVGHLLCEVRKVLWSQQKPRRSRTPEERAQRDEDYKRNLQKMLKHWGAEVGAERQYGMAREAVAGKLRELINNLPPQICRSTAWQVFSVVEALLVDHLAQHFGHERKSGLGGLAESLLSSKEFKEKQRCTWNYLMDYGSLGLFSEMEEALVDMREEPRVTTTSVEMNEDSPEQVKKTGSEFLANLVARTTLLAAHPREVAGWLRHDDLQKLGEKVVGLKLSFFSPRILKWAAQYKLPQSDHDLVEVPS